jgi:hypothetical protein
MLSTYRDAANFVETRALRTGPRHLPRVSSQRRTMTRASPIDCVADHAQTKYTYSFAPGE